MPTAPFCKFCKTNHWGMTHNFPKEEKPTLPKFRGNPKKLKDPDNILEPLPHIERGTKPFKNGVSYSPGTSMFKHNCQWCGKEFTGSYDKIYCSSNCRLLAWRNFKKTQWKLIETTGQPQEQKEAKTFISWGKKRFLILQRDHFKCKYCGRSAQDGYVLHIDHIHPKSKGGTDDMSNLVTACQECNLAKRNDILEHNPFA